MSNKSNSKQHGLVRNIRPKKVGHEKNNSEKAKTRRTENPRVKKVTA